MKIDIVIFPNIYSHLSVYLSQTKAVLIIVDCKEKDYCVNIESGASKASKSMFQLALKNVCLNKETFGFC